MYKIYTDGACKKNGEKGAKGGWAYVICDETDCCLVCQSGHEDNTTNQRMEITAILEACKAIHLLKEDEQIFSCNIYSDSAYCIRCYSERWYEKWESNGWKTANQKEVKNRELWKELIPFFRDSRFHFVKVKGHAECKGNILADKLAQHAAVLKI